MAILPNVTVKIETEPIVKLVCRNFNCKFLLVHGQAYDDDYLHCNLKHIEIGEDGRCCSQVEND